MYAIPLTILIVLALIAVAWSPIFALTVESDEPKGAWGEPRP